MDRRGPKGRRQNPTLNRGRAAQERIAAQRAQWVSRVPVGIAAVKRAQMGEKKGMDTDITLNPIISTTSTNASSFVLNLIQQGAGSWNRIGRKVYLKSLRLKGTFSCTQTPTVATGVGQNTVARMVVVWDQQPSGGAIPTFDQIFGITAQDGVESCPNFNCPPKYDNFDRFKVLKEELVSFPPFVSSSGSGPAYTVFKDFDTYLKLGNRECVFSGQSNPMTIADISTGAIYLYFRAGASNAVTTTAVIGTSRLRYSD